MSRRRLLVMFDGREVPPARSAKVRCPQLAREWRWRDSSMKFATAGALVALLSTLNGPRSLQLLGAQPQ